MVIGCGDSPADAPALVARGDRHSARGEYREAVIEYRNAVQADQTFGDARAKLAATYEKLGDGANALEEYIRAADLLPNDVGIQLTAGRYLLAVRRTDDALRRADAVLAAHPDNIEAHILRGNSLGGLNDLEHALTEMEEALRLDPARGVTYTQLGLVQAARGQASAAEAAFERAIELAPKEVGGHLALANFYWSNGRLPDAERALEAALALDSSSEGTNRALAVFALATGRVDEAEKYLKKISDLSRSPSSIFTLAEYYIATHRSAKAVELLEPLATDGHTIGAKQRLARAYAASNNTEKARSLIDGILKENPQDSNTLLLKAQLLLDAGHREEALPVVKAAVEADPTSIAAQFTLGRVHAVRGDIEGAKTAFKEVLKLNPAATAAQVELGTLELANANSAAAVRVLDAASSQAPTLESKIALVRGLLAQQEFDRASRELQVLLEKAPRSAPVHVQVGVLAASRNDQTRAKTAFETALSLDPESIEAFAGLVALDLHRKDFASAKVKMDRRLEVGTPSPALLLLAARTYLTVNDLSAAERTSKNAIQQDATLVSAYDLLAQVYIKQNRLAEAQQEFDNLSRRQSAPGPALTMSGLLLQASGNIPEAKKRYEQAVAADDRAVVAANNLAWIYADASEKLGDALRLARTAAELAPQNASVLDTLGWVYLQSSLPALAVPPLTRAATIEPKQAGYHYRLGVACVRSGEVERGRVALNRALELDRGAHWAADARRVLSELNAPVNR